MENTESDEALLARLQAAGKDPKFPWGTGKFDWRRVREAMENKLLEFYGFFPGMQEKFLELKARERVLIRDRSYSSSPEEPFPGEEYPAEEFPVEVRFNLSRFNCFWREEEGKIGEFDLSKSRTVLWAEMERLALNKNDARCEYSLNEFLKLYQHVIELEERFNELQSQKREQDGRD